MDNAKLKDKVKGIRLSKPLLNGIFIAAILVLIAISYFSYLQVKHLVTSIKWVNHTYDVIQKVDSSLYKIISLESDQRAYVLTGNEHFLIDMDNIKSDINIELQALKDLTKDNLEQTPRVARFITLMNNRLAIIQKVIKLKSLNKFDTQDGMTLFLEGQETSIRVRSLGQEIKSVEMVLLNERHLTAVSYVDTVNRVLIIGNLVGIVSLIIALLLSNRELLIRRSIEVQNKNTQFRLRKIIESTSDMIAAFDKDCRFIIFNEDYQREFKLIFGKSLQVGMSLNEALAEVTESKQSLAQAWRNSLGEDNTIKALETIVNDEKQIYELSANLIYNDKNEFNGAVQSIRNITNRVKEHTELQQSYAQLEQGMQALTEKNVQISLLVEMSDIMLASNSQEELSDVLSKYSARLLNFADGYLFVMHPSKNYLEVISKWGQPTTQEVTFTPDQCWAIRLGRKHHISGTNQSELLCSHIKIESVKKAYLCVPLMAQNDIYGLLYLEFEEKASIDENQRLLINAFAELVALALANVRLRENLRHQSIRDPLTGLYNRRYLEDFLFKQTHQAERAKSVFSVLMLDIDHFKKINDTYGHDAGDAVLKEFGQILQNIIRIGDVATRYGGEEFVVAFYDMDYQTTLIRAESIRQSVLRLQIRYGNTHVGPISVSIGIAMYPTDAKTPAELIEAADKALYFAKGHGRNQVVAFSDMKPDE
ncbi:sensor histidine kinase [Legionella beliardensis]|uniref:diguanylate cyclase n=1 Tax=Legionella beliardensis TaxID=91822 RepID=A0A378I3K6_9GAMM|nr:diguanylate cyclase [Legionella beliardensis]STX29305.1 sensor histidine kinase [Legionella beliardensis]